MGRNKAAIQFLEDEVRLTTDDSSLWYKLASLCEKEGRYSEALRAAKHCRRILEESKDLDTNNVSVVMRMIRRLEKPSLL
jgi:tetratricopeptide (TPR) repeat protein